MSIELKPIVITVVAAAVAAAIGLGALAFFTGQTKSAQEASARMHQQQQSSLIVRQLDLLGEIKAEKNAPKKVQAQTKERFCQTIGRIETAPSELVAADKRICAADGSVKQ
jgi:Tfp pilus assembly protein PilV